MAHIVTSYQLPVSREQGERAQSNDRQKWQIFVHTFSRESGEVLIPVPIRFGSNQWTERVGSYVFGELFLWISAYVLLVNLKSVFLYINLL